MTVESTAPGGVVEVRVSGTGPLVVVLAGRLTASCCVDLRAILLRARPVGVDDVALDAARVTAVDDAVFAVLLAAGAWVHATGGRIGFRHASASVRLALDALGLAALLPVPPPSPAVPAQRGTTVPAQRGAALV